MSRKSKQILGIFQKIGSNPNTDHNHLVFRGTLKDKNSFGINPAKAIACTTHLTQGN